MVRPEVVGVCTSCRRAINTIAHADYLRKVIESCVNQGGFMGIADNAVEIRARGWRTLAALHGLIESRLERSLQDVHQLSVVEFTVLDALSRQDGWHMRMQQLSRAAALSSSASTRLVNRLESRGLLERYLCADDRRGIYTELTQQGRQLLETARPTYNRVLEAALAEASVMPELAPLVDSLQPAAAVLD